MATAIDNEAIGGNYSRARIIAYVASFLVMVYAVLAGNILIGLAVVIGILLLLRLFSLEILLRRMAIRQLEESE